MCLNVKLFARHLKTSGLLRTRCLTLILQIATILMVLELLLNYMLEGPRFGLNLFQFKR